MYFEKIAFIMKLARYVESSSTNSDLNGEPTSVFDYSPDDYSDHYKSFFVFDGDCYLVSDNVHRDWMKRLEF